VVNDNESSSVPAGTLKGLVAARRFSAGNASIVPAGTEVFYLLCFHGLRFAR